MLALTTVLMAIAVLEFAPGRIDHHNVQIITMMAVMLGLLRWDRGGGWLIGAGSALSVVVGLECLPFVVIAFTGVVVCYLAGVRAAEKVLAGAATAMLATSVLSAAAFLGPTVAQMQCDAFSAPYLVLMVGASLILLAASKGVVTASFPVKLLVLCLPTALLLAAVAWLYPHCLQGPYQMIDPLSRTLWFNRIWQEKSFLLFFRNGDYNSVIGMDKDEPLRRFTRKIPAGRFTPALGPGTACGIFVETDDKTGLAKYISPLRVGGRLIEQWPAID